MENHITYFIILCTSNKLLFLLILLFSPFSFVFSFHYVDNSFYKMSKNCRECNVQCPDANSLKIHKRGYRINKVFCDESVL